MKTRELTQARLMEKLHYDPETGIFTRRPPDHNRKTGKFDRDGYVTIVVDYVRHQAHRLAWLYMTGSHSDAECIDHINGIRDDNRWVNLREATRLENMWNRHPTKVREAKSGVPGIYWDGRKDRWFVQYRTPHGIRYGGYHRTVDEASKAKERLVTEYASETAQPQR